MRLRQLARDEDCTVHTAVSRPAHTALKHTVPAITSNHRQESTFHRASTISSWSRTHILSALKTCSGGH